MYVIYSQNVNRNITYDLNTISIATPLLDASTLNFISKEYNLFEKNGLRVNLIETEPGHEGMNLLLQNVVDIAIVPDTVISKNIYDNNNFIVLSTLHYSNMNVQILFPNTNDTIVTKVSEIKNKKIGVIPEDVGEYFLYELLNHLDMNLSDVELVYGTREELINMLDENQIDAVSLRRLYIYQLQQKYGNGVFTVNGKNNYFATYNIVTTKDFVENNKNLLIKYYITLSEAEKFKQNNKSKIINLMSKKLQVNKNFVEYTLENSKYDPNQKDLSLELLVDNQIRYLNLKNNTNVKFSAEKYFDDNLTSSLLNSN